MDIISDYRLSYSVSDEATLRVAAERARIVAERVPAHPRASIRESLKRLLGMTPTTDRRHHALGAGR